MCPGRWLAYDSIWLSIACILSVYSIERAIDENGREIVPEVAYTSSLLRYALEATSAGYPIYKYE
jgi:hypothetical protein